MILPFLDLASLCVGLNANIVGGATRRDYHHLFSDLFGFVLLISICGCVIFDRNNASFGVTLQPVGTLSHLLCFYLRK